MRSTTDVGIAGFAGLLDLREASRTREAPGEARAVNRANRRLVDHPEADLVFVEQYRRLAAALHQEQGRKGTRTVMVASALASEGKTLTATNLALMLSRFRQRVLLVDGDLRKPSVHHLLEIENGIGLSDILKRPTGLITPWIVSPALSVVTGGHQDPDPVSLLVTGALEQFLANTRGEFDWIVVDTPPVVLFPDAGLFADRLDACVMVVNAAATTAPVAAAAVAALGRSRILGAVLNRAPSSEIAAGCDYGSYGYAERAARGRRAWWPFRRG